MILHDSVPASPNAAPEHQTREHKESRAVSILTELREIKKALHELSGVYQEVVILQRRLARVEARQKKVRKTDLTPREKEIHELCEQNLLHKEIAAKIGVSVGTVKSVEYRVRRKLKNRAP